MMRPNYRSSSYSIAQRSVDCPSCGASTRVAALALPLHHEVREDEEDGDCSWQSVAGNALLFYVLHLPTAVLAHLRRLAPGFRRESGGEPGDPGESAWSNHCEHCGAPIDDHDLHCEPGESFVPLTEAQGANISLIEIHEPIEAGASGYSLESLFLPFPPRP